MKIQNNQAFQTVKNSIAFQFKGKQLTNLLTGTVTKGYIVAKEFQVAPPQSGEWNNYVIFNALDTEKHFGVINTEDEYTFGNDSYYMIDANAEGEYYVRLTEYVAISEGTAQVINVYAREDESTSDPSIIGLVSHFGNIETGDEIHIYQYGPTRYSTSFLGSDEDATWFNSDKIDDAYGYVNEAGDEFYWGSNIGSTSAISVTGEKSETTDWPGKQRYYVETASGASITSEGYVYIDSRVNGGVIYPTRTVIGQQVSGTGVQGAVSTSQITDIDIMQSVNGSDWVKAKDVASEIEKFTDVPFGLYWKATIDTDFDGWVTK